MPSPAYIFWCGLHLKQDILNYNQQYCLHILTPLLSLMFLSASLPRRNFTAFAWPFLAARCRGVIWLTNKITVKMIQTSRIVYKIEMYQVHLVVGLINEQTSIDLLQSHYPFIVFDVDSSSFSKNIYHYFQTACFSRHVKGSSLNKNKQTQSFTCKMPHGLVIQIIEKVGIQNM